MSRNIARSYNTFSEAFTLPFMALRSEHCGKLELTTFNMQTVGAPYPAEDVTI